MGCIALIATKTCFTIQCLHFAFSRRMGYWKFVTKNTEANLQILDLSKLKYAN